MGEIMYHHSINKYVFAVPFKFVVNRVTYSANVAGEGVTGLSIYNPAIGGSVLFNIPAETEGPVSFFDDSGFAALEANDLLEVTLQNGSGLSGPEDISVVVAGYRVGD
jgi:hypothetical protein